MNCRWGNGSLFGSEEREIIGIVKDSPYLNLRRDVPAVAYQTFLQTNTGRGQMVLYARVRGDAALLTQQIREQVQRLDPTLPPSKCIRSPTKSTQPWCESG